jgi:hypothetical protein
MSIKKGNSPRRRRGRSEKIVIQKIPHSANSALCGEPIIFQWAAAPSPKWWLSRRKARVRTIITQIVTQPKAATR